MALGDLVLDMSKYGGQGQVVVGRPTFRRKREKENAAARALKFENSQLVATELAIGDIDTIAHLAYVKSAPFTTSLDSLEPFYDYCDMLDAGRLGAAEEFWNDLTEAIDRIEEGATHPLD